MAVVTFMASLLVGFSMDTSINSDVAGSSLRTDSEMESEVIGGMGGVPKATGSPLKKRVKKRKVENAVEEKDPLSVTQEVAKDLRRYLLAEGSRFSRTQAEYILERFPVMEDLVGRLVCRTERLEGTLEERDRWLSHQEKQVVGFADALKEAVPAKPVATPWAREPPSPVWPEQRPERKIFAVVVRPAAEAMEGQETVSSEKIKQKFLREVKGELKKVRVSTVRMITGGGITTVTETQGEHDQISACTKFQEVGLKVDLQRKVGPKVIVYDVPSEVKKEDFMEELFDRNLSDVV